MSRPALVLSDVALTWPDGGVVLDGVDLALGPGRTALVGANGSGKSTLLRVVAGLLRPSRGTVRVDGRLGHLRQDLTLDPALPVDVLLGIAGVRRAIRAIESGSADPDDFDAVGDDWGVDERARALLDGLGLERVGLDRRVGEISGGEAVLLGLAAELIHRPDVLLLDEPTNSLDRSARARLGDAVMAYSGVLVLVSHDRELLERVDQVAELRHGAVRLFGGDLDAYEATLTAEQEAAAQRVRWAGSELRRQQRDLVAAQTATDRRHRHGRHVADSGSLPRIVAGARKRQAQVSAGRVRGRHEAEVEHARERLAEAESAVRDDEEIRVDLAATALPPGRTALEITGLVLRTGTTIDRLVVRGPERVAVVGRNGAGKSTLLRAVDDAARGRSAATVRVGVPTRHLPQRLDLLDGDRSVVDAVAAMAPDATPNELRARLARFRFRGARADQPVASLSGGERLRATLAALLLATPPPQLLLLDEPTNDLDLASVRQLEQALAGYRGALVVASHDQRFLDRIGITRWWHLAPGAAFTELASAPR